RVACAHANLVDHRYQDRGEDDDDRQDRENLHQGETILFVLVHVGVVEVTGGVMSPRPESAAYASPSQGHGFLTHVGFSLQPLASTTRRIDLTCVRSEE